MKIAMLLVPAAEAASIVLKRSCLPLWARIVGALLGILGVAVFLCAVITMRDSWRGRFGNGQNGACHRRHYQVSRNPAFLGFDLVYDAGKGAAHEAGREK